MPESFSARSRVAVLFAIATLSAAGCGGAAEPKVDAKPVAEKETSKKDAAEIRDVVTQYMAAFAAGDGEAACNLMTEEALAGIVEDGKERTAEEAFEQCVEMIDGMSEFLEPEEIEQLKHPKFKSVKVNGDSAVVEAVPADGPAKLAYTEEYGWLLDGSID